MTQMTKGFQRFIMDPMAEAAWLSGSVVKGLNIRHNNGWVTLIVKAHKVPSRPMVAFVTARTYLEAMELLYTAVSGDKVTLKWKEDKFAGKRT